MIFLYHGVLPEGAPPARWCRGQALPLSSVRRHFQWLARRFRVVPIAEYLAATPSRRGPRRAAITFDDGTKETFENAVPVLRREGLPATLFISTGHLCGGPLLWFLYLDALCFEEEYRYVTVDGHRFHLDSLSERIRARTNLGSLARSSRRPGQFAARLAAEYPLRPETLERYAGMTISQLTDTGRDDLLEIGSHTVTHPYLTLVPAADQTKELSESRKTLMDLTGRPVRYFAYPGGDYDHATVARVQEAGYEAAFATRPRKVGIPRFEIGRVGIYSRSMFKLTVKAAGFVDLAESVGIRVG